MSILETTLANQQQNTDIAARIMRVRDHLIGEKRVDSPVLPAATVGGLLGEIENATARSAAITHFALDAINDIEFALGLEVPAAPVVNQP